MTIKIQLHGPVSQMRYEQTTCHSTPMVQLKTTGLVRHTLGQSTSPLRIHAPSFLNSPLPAQQPKVEKNSQKYKRLNSISQ